MVPKLSADSRVNEVSAVSINMINAYNKKTWDTDSNMVSIFTALTSKSDELTIAINRNKTESNLEEFDHERDQHIRALFYILKGCTYNPDSAIRTAAEKIFGTYSRYGLELTNLSYGAETAQISSLLVDLEETDLQEAIAKVPGCQEVITSLQTAQTNFESAYIEWESTKANEGLETPSTELKKEVLKIINGKIVLYLRAMQEMDNDTYGEFANTITEIINDNNEVVKRRRKKEELVE